ncbi:KUP/HAK/KT family potassium transporter [Candidatus Saccharibacteria bacterium]|nr:KUP/HAK/KT family potassium transporter [Candidatus Saccharibacteria bacterium]
MVKKRHSGLLVVGAIGVVFGDIGTSPLYVLQAIFGVSSLSLTPEDIRGVISLIIWSVTLVVTVKYISLIMRANNRGEGGIMALIALIWRTRLAKRKKAVFTILSLIGVSLFFGDSIITPAISVLSAVEGTKLIAPQLTQFVVPITLTILAGLFALQSKGTGTIGVLFGPIMIAWFIVSAIGGLMHVIDYPAILSALLPGVAVEFFLSHPLQGFIAMGAVVLAITGTEALYADMGHFGRPAISHGWLLLVFPALLLTYLGQGALVTQHPETIHSPFFLMFPQELQLPVIVLATFATLIASQAVISGAFSLARQAVALGFLPRLTIKHTSREEVGQVYLPFLNWIIAGLVAMVVIGFGSASNLASAFGMAVSGTLAIDTILFLAVMYLTWKRKIIVVAITGILLLSVDLLFLSSSFTKLFHGAWLPIGLAVAAFIVLSTWHKGHRIISRERHLLEGSLQDFVNKLHHSRVPRIPGYAIYLGHNVGNAPLALHMTVDQLKELHKNVVVVSVKTAHIPHVPERSRIVFDGLGHPHDNISHVTLQFGYKDTPNVPRALEYARHQSAEIDFDPRKATYFISIAQPVVGRNHRMSRWRKHLYLAMMRNASRPTDFFKLPLDRTVEMSSFVEL